MYWWEQQQQHRQPAYNGSEEKDSEKCVKAKAIVILSFEPTIYVHINKCATALDVWECLRKLYEDRGLKKLHC